MDHFNIVSLLLKYGADPNVRNFLCLTCAHRGFFKYFFQNFLILQYISKNFHSDELVSLLYEYTFKWNFGNIIFQPKLFQLLDSSGATALHLALANCAHSEEHNKTVAELLNGLLQTFLKLFQFQDDIS